MSTFALCFRETRIVITSQKLDFCFFPLGFQYILSPPSATSGQDDAFKAFKDGIDNYYQSEYDLSTGA